MTTRPVTDAERTALIRSLVADAETKLRCAREVVEEGPKTFPFAEARAHLSNALKNTEWARQALED